MKGEVEDLVLNSYGDLGSDVRPTGPAPSLDRRAIIAALFDRNGETIAATRSYVDLQTCLSIPPQSFDAARGGAIVQALAEFHPPWGGRELLPVALAPSSFARSWRLPDEISEATRNHAGVVLLTSTPARDQQLLTEACRALGLNGLETKVAVAAVSGQDVKTIGRISGVSANTAKEALAGAMRRLGVDRRAALAGRVSLLALGVLPRRDQPEVLCDIWGLSPRQARIAGLVANGVSRGGAAASLGLSEAVVRKELEKIYEAFDVVGAAGLSRKVAESQAIRWLTEVTEGDLGFHDDWSEPLAILRADDGRHIAYSDYGPRDARATLILHSTTSNRAVPRALLQALHLAGRRVIAIDRPGFGLSSDFRRSRECAHRDTAAARDTLLVLDKLKIADADIVSRHTSLALECCRVAPARFGTVVLINPGLPTEVDNRRAGLSGYAKTIFMANPWAIRQTLKAVATRMSEPRLAFLLRTWMEDSPSDREAVRRPEIVRDYFRTVRMFGTGRIAGAVAELIETYQRPSIEPLVHSDRWRILTGSSDILHDPEEMIAHWSHRLPGSTVAVVEGAGRLLPFTHPEAIVEALES